MLTVRAVALEALTELTVMPVPKFTTLLLVKCVYYPVRFTKPVHP